MVVEEGLGYVDENKDVDNDVRMMRMMPAGKNRTQSSKTVVRSELAKKTIAERKDNRNNGKGQTARGSSTPGGLPDDNEMINGKKENKGEGLTKDAEERQDNRDKIRTGTPVRERLETTQKLK